MFTHLMPHSSRPDVPPARRLARPRLAVLATALVAVLTPALGACAGDAASASGAGAGGNGTLKWTSSYFPAHWDPVVSGSGAQFRELALVYASLTRTDETGKAVPDLAESWEYNEKGDQVTFHLRPGLKFTDGAPLDATAVKDAVERAKKQKNSALFGDLTSIRSVDANGLDAVLHLTQVDYQIPQLLGQRVLQIASPKAAATPEKLDQNPVGAGPFTITQLVPGTKAVLRKNPAYWDAKNIHIDNVELTAAPDASTVVNGLQTGVYNFADIKPSQADAAKKAGLDVFVQPGFNASNISLNINKAPFDNDKVVDAVRHAVNRQEFVDKLTFGHGSVTNQPFPKGYIAPGSPPPHPPGPRDSAAQTLTAHFGPNGPLNLSSPYEPDGFEAAIAKVRQTPLDAPDYPKVLQAATRAGLQSKALVFTYSSPNLVAKSKSISALPKNPAHIDWTGVTISGN
ncbi:ABC transporter substrate-binding protein [Streptomyces sp. LN699]|uniref:ABC transporter substrate-binding protein n=1 Tax=Streptomyces sp. LN699 TaxID=3112981 RepID=UPI00371D2F66